MLNIPIVSRSFGQPARAGRYYVMRRPFCPQSIEAGSRTRPDQSRQVRVSGGYTQRPLDIGGRKHG